MANAASKRAEALIEAIAAKPGPHAEIDQSQDHFELKQGAGRNFFHLMAKSSHVYCAGKVVEQVCKAAIQLSSGQCIEAIGKDREKKHALPERVGSIADEADGELSNGPEEALEREPRIGRVIPLDVAGRLVHRESGREEDKTRGFRAGERKSFFLDVVDGEVAPRVGGTGVGEKAFAQFELDLAKLGVVEKGTARAGKQAKIGREWGGDVVGCCWDGTVGAWVRMAPGRGRRDRIHSLA